MKVCLFFVLGIAFFNAFAFGENAADFETLRALIREDTRAIVKEEIAASEKRTREFVSQEIAKLTVRMDERDRRVAAEFQAINNRIDDTNKRMDDTNSRFDDVNNRLNLNLTLLIALLGLIGVALGLPYLQDKKKERAQEEKIAAQQQQIEEQQKQLAAQQQLLETQQQQLAAQQQRMDAMETELKTLKQNQMPSS